MMSPFSEPWLRRYQVLVNSDTEMNIIGAWFTTALSLTNDSTRCVLRFERGNITDIVQAPSIDTRCAFGFRTSDQIWSKFLQTDPEPLYHDVFATLMRVPEFVLEGDTLIAMQNARALHRAMNLMRAV